MIELIVEDKTGSRRQLDLDQKVVIALSKQMLSLTDIEKRTGDYTKGFGLPKTYRNMQLFGNWGDPSVIGPNWDSRYEAPCWLLENTNIITEGSLRLESTNPDHDRIQVSISGQTFSIKSLLRDSLMSELDMSDWTYDLNDIPDTWDRSLFGGDMVFSVMDFGQGYGQYVKEGDPAVLTLQNIKNSATPLRTYETLPTFRLNELLRRIFTDRGFTIGGSWFSEAEAEEIYVQIANDISPFVPSASTLTTIIKNDQILNQVSFTVINFEAQPSAVNWDDTLHRYVAPQDGDYYWDLNLIFTQGTPSNVDVGIAFFKNGSIQTTPVFTPWNSSYSVSNVKISMVAGDYMDVRYFVQDPFTSAGFLLATSSNNLSLTFVDLSGVAINPAEFWAPYKQIDFLRNITQIFNLIIWVPETNDVRIDTWNYYQATYGSKKDWTNKLDITSVQVRPINGELRNPINISLTEADDVINRQYQSSAGRQFGSYFEDTGLPFTQDAADDITTFVPGPTQDIISTDPAADFPEFIVHKFYTDIDSIAYKATGLQLYYYNGVRTVDPFYIRITDISAAEVRTEYPYFSNFRLYAADSWRVQEDTLDLNFTYWTPAVDIVDVVSEEGLYNRYFREMLRERYDEANKVLDCKFVLTGLDVSNFNFADTILVTIKGTPVGLRILEIRDYSPSVTKSTQVKAMLTFIE